MAEEIPEGKGRIKRISDAIDRKLGWENPPDVKLLYQYPKTGEPVLWVDLLTKENNFKAWHYSLGDGEGSANIRTIPESRTRSVIHFAPPEAVEAFRRQKSEEDSWLEDPEFLAKSPAILRRNVAAFTDLLRVIRNGEWSGTDHIIGVTNYKQANFALALGFKRCWEEGLNPPDLSMPMLDESRDYSVGISLEELKKRYDMTDHDPTEMSVLKTITANRSL